MKALPPFPSAHLHSTQFVVNRHAIASRQAQPIGAGEARSKKISLDGDAAVQGTPRWQSGAKGVGCTPAKPRDAQPLPGQRYLIVRIWERPRTGAKARLTDGTGPRSAGRSSDRENDRWSGRKEHHAGLDRNSHVFSPRENSPRLGTTEDLLTLHAATANIPRDTGTTSNAGSHTLFCCMTRNEIAST